MNGKKEEDDLVDVGSEYSFPASDPPSYMGGALVVGAPSQHDGLPPREAANHELIDSGEAKPAGDAPQGADPARTDNAVPKPDRGGSNT